MTRLGRGYPVSRVLAPYRKVVAPSVIYDATGAGATGTGTTVSWSHTAAAGAYAVVGVSTGSSATVTGVTYGGTSMTSLGSVSLNNSAASGTVYLFGLSGVTSGSNTVTATLSAAGGVGNSVSYTGVTSAGSAQTTFGTGTTSLSQSTTGGGASLVTVQIFAANDTFSAYNGTQRSNIGTAGPGGVVIDIGDSGTANKTFTATLAVGRGFGGVAVVLAP